MVGSESLIVSHTTILVYRVVLVPGAEGGRLFRNKNEKKSNEMKRIQKTNFDVN